MVGELQVRVFRIFKEIFKCLRAVVVHELVVTVLARPQYFLGTDIAVTHLFTQIVALVLNALIFFARQAGMISWKTKLVVPDSFEHCLQISA